MTGSPLGDAGAPPFIRLENITKRFGAVLANDGVTLDIGRGRIHGLVGENGAGKSTLMRILYGMIPPDGGRILIDGRPVAMKSPRDALALGIGMVHQHLMIVPELTVLENIILGSAPGRGPFVDLATARARLAARAPGAAAGIDLDRPAGDLPLGGRQRVEILKLLYRDAQVLILDEPTAVLPPAEVRRLFIELRRLADEGRTIILITHKLLEVKEATDDVSVLRQGRLVSTRPTRDAAIPQLAAEIVGSPGATLDEIGLAAPAGKAVRPPGSMPVLRLTDVVAPGADGRGGLKGLTLDIYPGEITAIAGVEGNGPGELARVVGGRLKPVGGSVTWLLEVPDAAGGGRTSAPAYRGAHNERPGASHRVGYIPEDRHHDGLVLPMTLARNLILGRQRQARFRKERLFLDDAAIDAHARRLIERHDIRPADPARPAGTFSGGNQQKAIVAREVEEDPALIVAAHPTRGLDLKAARAVHDLLRERRDRGAAVVLVTAELDEARLLGDRLVVLFDGRVAGEVDPVHATEQEIGLLMTGGRPA